MKRGSMLVAIPLAAAALAGMISYALGVTPSRVWFQAVTALVVKTMAFAGCYVAARSFGRTDYLRRAWILVAIGYLPLVLKDILPGGGPWSSTAPAVWGYARASLALAGNALSVVGAWIFARTSRVAGLEPPGSPAMRRATIALVTLAAVAFVAPGLWSDWKDARGGDASAMINVAGDLGDVASFLLITPVLLTAVALRGGRLVWPWALLTAGNVAWLLFDAPVALGTLTGGMTPGLKNATEMARVAACLFYAGAGMAQRWALEFDGSRAR